MTDEKGVDHGTDSKSEKTPARKSGRVRFSAVVADCDKDDHQIATERCGRSRERSSSSSRVRRSPTPFVRRSPSAYSSADDGNEFQDDDKDERHEGQHDDEENCMSHSGSLRNRRHLRDGQSREEKSSKTNAKGGCSDSADPHPLQNDENKENHARPVSRASSDCFDHIGEFDFIADDFGSATLTQHGWNNVETSEFEHDTTNTMHTLRTEISQQSLHNCHSRTPSISTMYDFDTCAEVEIHIFNDDDTVVTKK